MRDLERLVRGARPDAGTPLTGAEDRILAGLGLPAAPSPRRRGRFLASRRGRLLVTAAALVGSGAALAVALVGGSGGGGGGAAASLRFTSSEVVERTSARIEGADLAVDRRGAVTVVWSRAGRVRTSARPRGGAWTTPVRVSDPRRRATDPAIMARRGGGALVVWREKQAGRVVRERVTLPGGRSGGELRTRVGARWTLWTRASELDGTWGPPRRIGPVAAGPQDLADPQVGATPQGAAVAFVRSGRVWVGEGSGSGPWAVPSAVSAAAGGVATDPHLVTDADARWAVLTWTARRETAEGRRWQVGVSVRDPDGRWSAAVPLGDPSAAKVLPTAAVDGAGRVAVAWDAGSPGIPATTPTLVAFRDAAGAWTQPEPVPTPSGGSVFPLGPPAIGRDAGGGTVILVTRGALITGSARPADAPATLLVRRDAGGTWQPARRIPPGFGAAITPDARGGLVVALPGGGRARTLLEALAADGRVRGRTTLPGASFPFLLDAGRDGTTAAGLVLAAGSGSQLRVDVAPGGGR